MNTHGLISVSFLLLVVVTSSAEVRYVDCKNPAPASPFTNWSGAAVTIQDAIDVAADGDTILVNDGLYATGGRAASGIMTNRVVVSKALRVESVNGPGATLIAGNPGPDRWCGAGAVRCVYMKTGAVLSGFTLTNGFTTWPGDDISELSGGGLWCETNAIVTNCVIVNCTAAINGGGAQGGIIYSSIFRGNGTGFGGGAHDCALHDCVFQSNIAGNGGGAANSVAFGCRFADNYAGTYGGGACDCTVYDSTFERNRAGDGSDLEAGEGGGIFNCTANNCAFRENGAFLWGGGASDSTVSNCTFTANMAPYGGGACSSTVYNSIFTRNSVEVSGGGAMVSTLHACAVVDNTARHSGGGVDSCSLFNCTVTGNSAPNGGGANQCIVTNSIVWFNNGRLNPNHSDCTFYWSCTTPMPRFGSNNIAVDPQLASGWRLSPGSPCIRAGTSNAVWGVDLDGEPWHNPPSMGADELTGDVQGPLDVTILASSATFPTGFPVSFEAQIEGAVWASVWYFGDGTIVTNEPGITHLWNTPGNYSVLLAVYNLDHPEGVIASVSVEVIERSTFYVDAASASPAYPYTNWTTAARTIQEAIDAGTTPGRTILVAPGIYDSGVAIKTGLANRIVVPETVLVQSIGGPAATFIVGAAGLESPYGEGAVRCVYACSNSILSGFTLTNGHTGGYSVSQTYAEGGGALCEAGAMLTNCVLTGNFGQGYGGGAASGILYNCQLTNNISMIGGGAWDSDLHGCILTSNVASYSGGGSTAGVLHQCVLRGNRASYGGGQSGGILYGCVLTGNTAQQGGGADDATLYNCTVTRNIGTSSKTVVEPGGGLTASKAYNCIVYYNDAPIAPNYGDRTALYYSCTSPLYTRAPGNLSIEPQLASTSHLSAGSPCAAAGSSLYAFETDIDGNAWLNPPSIGADQVLPGTARGPLTVSSSASFTNVTPGFSVGFAAEIDGNVTRHEWDFGDGSIVSNRINLSHAWSAPGTYAVRLTAWNDDNLAGISSTTMVTVADISYYADQSNPKPVYPYTNIATAAQTIQEAIDAAAFANAKVIVLPGDYSIGGRPTAGGSLTNRICIDKPLIVTSLNGPETTRVTGAASASGGNGLGAARGAYVGAGARLVGLTITGGHTFDTNPANPVDAAGGGAWCEDGGYIDHCVLVSNSAATDGGGAWGGVLSNCSFVGNRAGRQGGAVCGDTRRLNPLTLVNCAIKGNSAPIGGGGNYGNYYNCTVSGNIANRDTTGLGAPGYGGGIMYGALVNCTVMGNLAMTRYGGVAFCTCSNSIIYANTGGTVEYANWGDYYSTLWYCCTLPAPRSGFNITNWPTVVDWANGDFRLTSQSPCINSGDNACVPPYSTDFASNPRISGGTVDIGAYEFQNPISKISYAWLRQYGLPIDSASDSADLDGDGLSNWQEWRALTDPRFATSVLRVMPPEPGPDGITIRWSPMPGSRIVFVERASEVGTNAEFRRLATGVTTNAYTDTNVVSARRSFYRIGVE